MSYDNLAKGRYSESNQIYFITTVVNKRKKIFIKLALCRTLILNMKKIEDEGLIESFSWVVMPDHLHWLIKVNDGHDLAEIMKKFKGRSALEINRALGRQGTFWQHGYYDHALRKEEDIKQVARYIVANPLRAGLVDKIKMYPYWDAKWV